MTYAFRIRLKNNHAKKRIPERRKYNQRRNKIKQNETQATRVRVLRATMISGFFLLLALIIGGVFFMYYLQGISQDLPTPEKPFGKKNTTSIIYDRSGNQLYRVFGDEDRDPVKLTEIPPFVKWTYIAAEDENFYTHPGIDVGAIMRCFMQMLHGEDDVCGASTITQQLIKKTALSEEVTIERKIKEMIMALKIERERSKDEILEMYLTIIPEGSNIYGVTRGARFYFGKELKDLNLAEISILAAIPQNPSRLSPTKSLYPESALRLVKERQGYVLDQLLLNMESINAEISEETNGAGPFLSKEQIALARETEVTYKAPVFSITAPHFVFYVQKLLQERGYNGGKPFTMEEIETGGLRIFTTLDLEMQRTAEEQVRYGVERYGSRFGSDNAALLALNPKNGEIMAMAGSYDYFSKPKPEGCSVGVNCRLDPQVNLLDSMQAYGSTMKPFIYYSAAMKGMLAPETTMFDVPIDINGYRPKNYEGKFYGPRSARWMLINSRNIPAITLVAKIGVPQFLTELRAFGYSNFKDPAAFGPSIAVGGGDVNLIEHANAYAVLANGGYYSRYEAVLRIEDVNGNILYQHQPENTKVADERGVFLINDMLNGRKGGPGMSWDGRDIAGKTGTSESQKETLFITYTPEIVVLGVLGNNNNQGMRYGATGFTSVRPWTADFVKRLGSKIPATRFAMPAGVIRDRYGRLYIKDIMAPYALPVPQEFRQQNLAGKKIKS